MAHEFRLERRVEFADTDMAGIMHFANFFRLMEATEHAFFRSLGLALHENTAGGAMAGWVRVHAECDYVGPLRYPDLVEVRLRVTEVGSSSLSYAFEFRRSNEPEAEPSARGALKVVHVVRGAQDEKMRAVDMPAEVSRRIEVAPPAN
jgi:acyl-CoA thioester hydrolase